VNIFHLVSPKPRTFDELLQFTERFLDITGVRCVSMDDFDRQAMSTLAQLVDSQTAMYQPYFQDRRIFDARKATQILQKSNIVCPDLAYAVFSRCVEYAIKVGWGKQLFAPPRKRSLGL